MKTKQWPWRQVILLALALLGALDAVYLTFVHYNENVPLVCSTSGVIDCARVLSSPFSLVPGTSLPITLPGLAWCLVAAALAAYAIRSQHIPRWLLLAEFAWMLLGLLSVLYLVYAEIVRLHSICAWCTVLHVFILAMFLVSMVQLLQKDADTADDATTDEDLVVSGPDRPSPYPVTDAPNGVADPVNRNENPVSPTTSL